NGQGDIRDFPGNYSDYREWKEMKERHERSQQKPVKTKPVQTSKPTEKTKLTYNERREFERLEQEIAQLEEEKRQLESDLSSGTLSVSEVTDKSKRYSELLEELDAKSTRWLELSEYV
ncbi:MAG: ABC transporter ATP-binding protein, partial [Phocaeicola sp.]|nr:ABC transporter ATP-binding protein [Phocaeicola sp.]